MKDSILLQILDTMSRSVLNDLELAKAIKHPGESGRARERILTSFLTKLVGDTFGVSTGFVIDTNGAISKQIDLIIYRNDYHPRLDIGGIHHFLVEAVVATIEVKAAITSSERLTEAIDNVKSVKELDRSGGGRNIVLTDRLPDVSFDPDNFSHQVFGAIVTERSLAIEIVHDQLYGTSALEWGLAADPSATETAALRGSWCHLCSHQRFCRLLPASRCRLEGRLGRALGLLPTQTRGATLRVSQFGRPSAVA